MHYWASVNVNRVTALALVIVIALAGCSSLGPMAGAPTPTETTQSTTTSDTTTAQSTDTETQTATPTATATSTPFVATPRPDATPVPTETWTKPDTPKSPEDKGQDRISNVKFVNKEESSSGSGYTDFDIQVSADTYFSNIDPTPSEDGEPYIYVEINGEPIAREEVNLRQDGTFLIEIHPGALKQFDSGTLEVSVTLYDDDHKYDDNYGSWTGTIQYTSSDS
jgi:predicted small lipoprotein YifL